MRVIKLLSILFIVSLFTVSCEQETPENVVFYNKDQISKNLPIVIQDTEGSKVSVNSKVVVSLSSSAFFQENMQFLREVDVPKMCFMLNNYTGSPTSLTNVKVFLDEIEITNSLGANFLNANNNNVSFDIENKNLLNTIATKLMDNRQVVISYYSDAITQDQLDFDFEFSITAKGTFVD